jgi:uroporphyrinogen decarboxylase
MDALEMKAAFEKHASYDNIPVKPGEMSPRERFLATMNFKKPDRIIDGEFGYWADTLKRWRHEGMPAEIVDDEKANIFFGFDQWSKGLPIISDLHPGFPEEVIEQAERYTVKYDWKHVKCQVFTDGADSIPHYLDFPIKDRATYLPFKERFQAATAGRIPKNFVDIAKQVKNRNYVLTMYAGSTAGWIRDLMGFEGFSINTCMQPDLVDEILDDYKKLFTSLATEVVKYTDVDCVVWWEDIAFKTGPILSPDYFMAKCGPVYKAVMDIYAKHGTRFGYVDCDGDNRLLVPTWLENGVNIIFPLEVNAGVHPQALRERYPGVRMMGGVDKVVLLKGKTEIRKELKRLKPLVDEGGFIPHVDHRVQADVPYQDYLYYLEVKRDLFGIPNKVMG